jgi:hypothetical protein
MYWQREVFRTGKSFDVGGHYREELPDNGLLGGISVHISGTPVNDALKALEKWRLMDYLSELKVVGNGNRVLKAVHGPVQQAQSYWNGASPLQDKQHSYATSTLRYHTYLPFGRGIFDPQMGLDLGAWKSVELDFTNDAAVGQFASGFSIDVILHWLREASPSQFAGWLQTVEHRKWTTISDEIKYIDLPTDHRLRRLFLHVLADVDANMVDEATPYNVAHVIKLKLKSGAVEVFNGNLRDLWHDNAFQMGRTPIVGVEPYQADGIGFTTGLGQTLAAGGVRLPHGGTQNTYGPSLVPGQDGQTLVREVPSDAEQDAFILAGLAYENCGVFDFAVPDEPMTYLDLAAQGTVKLEVKTRSGAAYADGTIRVVLENYIQGQGQL